MRCLNRFVELLSIILKKRYYPFISRISQDSFEYIKNKSNFNNLQDNRDDLESYIGSLFDSSYVNMFASARMGFYSILKSLDLPHNTEIILTGFTCSVMVNAVIRAGCKPVFADINTETFGSDIYEIQKKITKKTRVIVAQHSFGIPCKIDEIQKYCKKNDLFLIEDCALSFMSEYKGKKLGLWGDAAIFSLDHTKPVNTLIGGYVLTRNFVLHERIVEIKENSAELPMKQQWKIWLQLCREYKNVTPLRYPKYKFLMALRNLIISKLKFPISPFLVSDSGSNIIQSIYSYPSKYPQSLSVICMKEMGIYIDNIADLKRRFKKVLMKLQEMEILLPESYFDANNNIAPLRIAFVLDDEKKKAFFTKRIDGSWFWFKQPIESTKEPLANFGYVAGSCPNAEITGALIINIPILNLMDKDIDIIFTK